MPRSYGVAFTGTLGSATHTQLGIWEPATPLSRFRVFEWGASASPAPADNTTRYTVNRFATAPTGGTALSGASLPPLDVGEPASAALGMGGATGADVIGAQLMMVSVNQRATYRWVAAPTKELVCLLTTLNGIGIYAAYQSGAYAMDLYLMWDE